ncbi:MAG: S41 family peptidase [Clostridiales bacterium]
MVSKKITIIFILIAICITFVGTAVMSSFVSISLYKNQKTDSDDIFNDVTIDDLDKFNEVKSILKKDYYKNVEDSDLLEGAIGGMAESLEDPYTVYYDKEEMEEFNKVSQNTEDTYVGIGVQVYMDENGILTVIEPFEASPAIKEGIKSGDKIIEVDGKDVTTIKDEDVIINMIKGVENTDVKITVYRPSEKQNVEFKIKRKKMTVVLNIRSKILEDDIGYIKLSVFDNDIFNNFKAELEKLKDKNIKGLVIDVRNNPGGLYNEVVNMANYILPKGVIVSTEDRNGTVEKEMSDANELDMPLTILVNENSASASEILAGSVQDYKKGTIVGTTTFGKGLVQTTKSFKDGSGIKLTISRYFTPKGVCIHEKGIKPDVIVKLDEKYDNEPLSLIPEAEDKQLQKAIEVIEKEIK